MFKFSTTSFLIAISLGIVSSMVLFENHIKADLALYQAPRIDNS